MGSIRAKGIRTKRPVGERRRWARKLLLALSALALATECAAAVLTSAWFHVKEVRVTGLTRLSKGEASATSRICRIHERTRLFAAPTASIRKQLEDLPWVSTATVRRVPPSSLAIEIAEKRPFAVALAAGRHWEVDRHGVVIRRASNRGNLPLIECNMRATIRPGRSLGDGALMEALQVVNRSRRLHAPEIDKIIVDPTAYICLNMSDGVSIRLGRTDELDTKINLVATIYREQPDISETIESIDLTAPDHPACRPRSNRSEVRRAGSLDRRSRAVASGTLQRDF